MHLFYLPGVGKKDCVLGAAEWIWMDVIGNENIWCAFSKNIPEDFSQHREIIIPQESKREELKISLNIQTSLSMNWIAKWNFLLLSHFIFRATNWVRIYRARVNIAAWSSFDDVHRLWQGEAVLKGSCPRGQNLIKQSSFCQKRAHLTASQCGRRNIRKKVAVRLGPFLIIHSKSKGYIEIKKFACIRQIFPEEEVKKTSIGIYSQGSLPVIENLHKVLCKLLARALCFVETPQDKRRSEFAAR
jgi:hypothetical protein